MPKDKEVQPSTFVIPIDNEDRIKDIIKESLDGLDPRFPIVKMPSSGAQFFEVPTEGEPEARKELEGIIIDRYRTRVYWEQKYSGDKTPPDCFSMDGETGSKYGDCFKCKFNEWGSAKDADGKPSPGKACQERHRTFLLTTESIFPLQLSVPPTSKENLSAYITKLAGRGHYPKDVVTKIRLSKAKNKKGIEYSRLEFFKGADLDETSKKKAYAIAASLKEAMRRKPIESEEVNDADANDVPF